ncbi:MAG: nitroreductase family protein [Phototrophicaceae bacterium]
MTLLNAESMLQLLQSRRSLRRYTSDPVPHELLVTILESATWAPSAHNRQPWRFAVLREFATRVQLAQAMGNRLRQDLMADAVPQQIIDEDVNRSYERITQASVLIVLCLTMEDMDHYPDDKRAQNERIMAQQSVAMAGQNLLLAAHAVGLGACWMCAPLFCQDVVQTTLELPTHWEAQALITLGYPAQSREKQRRPLSENVLWR